MILFGTGSGQLLLHCFPISGAKPKFMLHLLHNLSNFMSRLKRFTRHVLRRCQALSPTAFPFPICYLLSAIRESWPRFFQFQCRINRDFPCWMLCSGSAFHCRWFSVLCDDIFQLRKDHKALSKAVWLWSSEAGELQLESFFSAEARF